MIVVENEKISLGSVMGTGSQADTFNSDKLKGEAPPLQNTALKESTEKYHQQKESAGGSQNMGTGAKDSEVFTGHNQDYQEDEVPRLFDQNEKFP